MWCTSADGHAALEVAHTSCDTEADAGEGANLVSADPDCTDASFDVDVLTFRGSRAAAPAMLPCLLTILPEAATPKAIHPSLAAALHPVAAPLDAWRTIHLLV